ncbi:hypothetical protein N2152v2_010978 [Parachlorella kessleri]
MLGATQDSVVAAPAPPPPPMLSPRAQHALTTPFQQAAQEPPTAPTSPMAPPTARSAAAAAAGGYLPQRSFDAPPGGALESTTMGQGATPPPGQAAAEQPQQQLLLPGFAQLPHLHVPHGGELGSPWAQALPASPSQLYGQPGTGLAAAAGTPSSARLHGWEARGGESARGGLAGMAGANAPSAFFETPQSPAGAAALPRSPFGLSSLSHAPGSASTNGFPGTPRAAAAAAMARQQPQSQQPGFGSGMAQQHRLPRSPFGAHVAQLGRRASPVCQARCRCQAPPTTTPHTLLNGHHRLPQALSFGHLQQLGDGAAVAAGMNTAGSMAGEEDWVGGDEEPHGAHRLPRVQAPWELPLLETAVQTRPQLFDAEWRHADGTLGDPEAAPAPRPSRPVVTPPSFPSDIHPSLRTDTTWRKLSPETAFFAFYFQQESWFGSRQQLFAANALKAQGWRYHTQFNAWFARQGQPKVVTDTYEQGPLIYFDCQLHNITPNTGAASRAVYSGWCPRVSRPDFIFDYQHMENEDTTISTG